MNEYIGFKTKHDPDKPAFLALGSTQDCISPRDINRDINQDRDIQMLAADTVLIRILWIAGQVWPGIHPLNSFVACTADPIGLGGARRVITRFELC
jgi:hypothetical protein